jgi:hypothetical protein
MINGASLQAELRTIAAGAIGIAYMGVGLTTGNSSQLLLIQNLTGVPLWVSFDGIRDHFPLTAFSSKTITLPMSDEYPCAYFFEKHGRIYVKQFGGPAVQGGVYITLFYSTNS